MPDQQIRLIIDIEDIARWQMPCAVCFCFGDGDTDAFGNCGRDPILQIKYVVEILVELLSPNHPLFDHIIKTRDETNPLSRTLNCAAQDVTDTQFIRDFRWRSVTVFD